jgi:hypothetical protein
MALQCGNCNEYVQGNGKPHECTVTVSLDEFRELKRQVAEIHEFVSGLAGALNSPMVKAMLPPNMRGMLGG